MATMHNSTTDGATNEHPIARALLSCAALETRSTRAQNCTAHRAAGQMSSAGIVAVLVFFGAVVVAFTSAP